jgi:hypothetical protein
MARNYSTRDFFRQMPNALLARYFTERGVLAEMNFAALKEAKPEPLFAAWLELPEGQRNAMDAELREIHALSSEKGWCAIRDEAAWQLREEPEAHRNWWRSWRRWTTILRKAHFLILIGQRTAENLHP